MLSRPVIQWMALSDGPTTSVTLPSLQTRREQVCQLAATTGSCNRFYPRIRPTTLSELPDSTIGERESALLDHRDRRPHGRRLSLLQRSLPRSVSLFDFVTRHFALK